MVAFFCAVFSDEDEVEVPSLHPGLLKVDKYIHKGYTIKFNYFPKNDFYFIYIVVIWEK